MGRNQFFSLSWPFTAVTVAIAVGALTSNQALAQGIDRIPHAGTSPPALVGENGSLAFFGEIDFGLSYAETSIPDNLDLDSDSLTAFVSALLGTEARRKMSNGAVVGLVAEASIEGQTNLNGDETSLVEDDFDFVETDSELFAYASGRFGRAALGYLGNESFSHSVDDFQVGYADFSSALDGTNTQGWGARYTLPHGAHTYQVGLDESLSLNLAYQFRRPIRSATYDVALQANYRPDRDIHGDAQDEILAAQASFQWEYGRLSLANTLGLRQVNPADQNLNEDTTTYYLGLGAAYQRGRHLMSAGWQMVYDDQSDGVSHELGLGYEAHLSRGLSLVSGITAVHAAETANVDNDWSYDVRAGLRWFF